MSFVIEITKERKEKKKDKKQKLHYHIILIEKPRLSSKKGKFIVEGIHPTK